MEARYTAIPSHYSSNVLNVLEAVSKLHERQTADDNASNMQPQPSILIGAITDGNSDPRNVPELQPYFDFCINAEQVGVSKPDQRVYLQAALQHVFANDGLHDMGLPATLTTEDQVEDVIGSWWIHIGDDFTKDIVAPKNLNMSTIWARELILDKIREKESQQSQEQPPPPQQAKEDIASQYTVDDKKSSPEKELVEFQKKINSKTVVKMAVGADDYLSSSIEQEFADAIIDSFADLPSVLEESHDQSQQTVTPEPKEAPITAAVKAPAPAISADANANTDQDDLLSKTKFCVFCGNKIPMVAKFCSACSKEQPQVQR